MQRKGTFLTIGALCAGVIIALLRVVHIKTYSADSLPPYSFLTTVLSAAAIAAIVFAFAAAYMISKRKDSEKSVFKSMASNGSGFYLLLQIIAAVLIFVHGIISYPTTPEIIKNHNAMAFPLAILFAVTHIGVSVFIYKGKNTKLAGILGVLSPLYFCLQLGEIFYANMANPILLEYSYECLTLGACTLYLMAMAGTAVEKDQVFSTIFTALLALICAPAALTGIQLSNNRTLIYIAILLIIIPSFPVYTKNLVKREKKAKKTKKA